MTYGVSSVNSSCLVFLRHAKYLSRAIVVSGVKNPQ